MEKVEDAPFTPEDRIGALEMQSLNVTDNRAFLLHHLSSVQKLGAGNADPKLKSLLSSGEE